MSRQYATIYVANLPWQITEDDLVELFAPFGEVIDARVIQDPATGRSRGYGFIDYSDESCVLKAVNSLDGYLLNGRRLLVCPAKPKPRRSRPPNK